MCMCVCAFVCARLCECVRVCALKQRGEGEERGREGEGKERQWHFVLTVDMLFNRPGTLVWTCFRSVSYEIV